MKVAELLPLKVSPIPLIVNKFKLKGLLHCFLTCIEIFGNYWYCFILKNVENRKEKFQRIKK